MFKLFICLAIAGLVMCSKSPTSVNGVDQAQTARVFIPRSTNIMAINITLKCDGNIKYQFSSVFLPDTFTFTEGKRIYAQWKTTAGTVSIDTIATNGLQWQLGY
jgi:hypothetical protein